MNGIEKITGQIEADVQREIDDLTAQAQAQAAEILADYEARARAEAEATLKRGALAAAQREERLGDMARLEARKLTLGTKQEMVERQSAPSRKPWISVVPLAMEPSMTLRWEMDLSPGTVTEPRMLFAGESFMECLISI